MTRRTFQQACVDAIAEEMRHNQDVFIMGEDIGAFGGPLKSTDGLWEEFGSQGRVIDMPISEGTIVGAAIGAALQGKRPIVDLMFLEFLGLVMQQLLDSGAMHYYSAGHMRVPVVIRAKYGVGPFPGHAYDLHSWAANVPGIKIVAPSTPRDAKAMMISAIRDDNPVLFLEHMALYHAGKEDITEDLPVVPIGKANIIRQGNDLTIIGAGLMVNRAKQAAKKLAQLGIESDVIDLRTIIPLDKETVITSVKKTGRVIILSEAVRAGNSAHEIASLLADHAFNWLKAPIKLISSPTIPVPFHRDLEKAFIPNVDDIVETACSLLDNNADNKGILAYER